MRLTAFPLLKCCWTHADIGEDQTVILGPRVVEHARHAERRPAERDAVARCEVQPGSGILADQRLAALLRIHARCNTPPFLEPLFGLEIHARHQDLRPLHLGLDEQLRRNGADVLFVLDRADPVHVIRS